MKYSINRKNKNKNYCFCSVKILILLFFLLLGNSLFSQTKKELDSYFNAVFSGNYPKAKTILLKIKKNYPESIKTKLIISNYYSVMFQISGGEEKFFIISKKYADEAVTRLKKKQSLTNDDVFRIISAKSLLLKMEVQRKNYVTVAKDMQSVIKYFNYATKHEEDEKLKYISGMYQYYVEIAKEDYPVIYPILLFYPSGNKKNGLKLMKECTNSANINTMTRSLHQLALIYYRDEKNMKVSEIYFKKLLEIYPENLIWQTEYYIALKKYNLNSEYVLRQNIIKNKILRNTFLNNEQKKYFLKKAELSLP